MSLGWEWEWEWEWGRELGSGVVPFVVSISTLCRLWVETGQVRDDDDDGARSGFWCKGGAGLDERQILAGMGGRRAGRQVCSMFALLVHTSPGPFVFVSDGWCR